MTTGGTDKTAANASPETIDVPNEAVEATSPKSSQKSSKLDGSLSEDEKLKRRAEKFGVFCEELETDKKKMRADRFKIFHPDLEADKMKNRAKRFDIDCPELESEKLLNRAKRFEIDCPEVESPEKGKKTGDKTGACPTLDTQKLLDRAKRFDVDCPELETAKRLKRMERFGAAEEDPVTTTSSEITSTEKPSKLSSQESRLVARAKKFGVSSLSEEDRKKLRADRFN